MDWHFILLCCFILLVFVFILFWIKNLNNNKTPNYKLPQREIMLHHIERKILDPSQSLKIARIETDFEKSLALLKSSFISSHDSFERGNALLAMGDLYKDETIPDAEEAIKYYLMALQEGHEDAILQIYKIYEHGLHPYYLPDKMVARKILYIILYDLSNVCSQHLLQIARTFDKELGNISYIDLDQIKEQDREYRQLPLSIEQKILMSISKSINIIPSKAATLNPQSFKQQTNKKIKHTSTSHKNSQINTTRTVMEDGIELTDEELMFIADIPSTPIANDSQNVHSSTLNNGARNTLDIIAKTTPTLMTSFEHNVNDFINQITSYEPIEDVKTVLQSLKTLQHSKFNMSEQDAFNLVWSRINDPINASRKKEMVQVLAQNVASGVEHSLVVCSTGKIMRIVGSLDSLDLGNNIELLKPEWAIKDEIGRIASRIRTEVYENSFERERDAFDKFNPSREQEEDVIKMVSHMKEQFIIEVERYYVNTRILTREKMQNIIEPYLENF